jgi:secreted trypsin-like serine protease
MLHSLVWDLRAAASDAPLLTPGTKLRVSGWGLTTENGNFSTDLLWVEVPVSARTVCADRYPNRIDNTKICAGDSAKDSCQGDSGGPLSGYPSSGVLLIGIVSFGYGCGREGFPGVYTRVSAFADWIRNRTGIR